MKVEEEYERQGALTYLAAWNVRRAKVFGRCEESTGMVPFDKLVEQVMEQEPYRSAPRVFWVMDNGSSIGDRVAINEFKPNGRISHRSIPRFTQAGLVGLRSTFPSCNARC